MAAPEPIVGPVHKHDVALSLNKASWWLATDVGAADPQAIRLIFEADTPEWINLTSASDDHGAKLDLRLLSRGLTEKGNAVSERVSIAIPQDLAAAARKSGLAITVSGPVRWFLASIPAAEMVAFLAKRNAEPVPAEAASATPPTESPDQDKPVAADPFAAAKAGVVKFFVDPEAAEFRNLHVATAGQSADKVCGEVNPRSTAGDYAGFRRFVYLPATDSSIFEQPGTTASDFEGLWSGC